MWVDDGESVEIILYLSLLWCIELDIENFKTQRAHLMDALKAEEMEKDHVSSFEIEEKCKNSNSFIQ